MSLSPKIGNIHVSWNIRLHVKFTRKLSVLKTLGLVRVYSVLEKGNSSYLIWVHKKQMRFKFSNLSERKHHGNFLERKKTCNMWDFSVSLRMLSLKPVWNLDKFVLKQILTL